ncbi:MAG TPA: hypothetical protein VGY99_32690 [Candidatus Binataceae bacterium]|jgi:hypothetical protein|nr:hypothetical protein [Candidatus Binataceae bacterium]
MKHDYFIEDLGQPAGWFKAHRYRYSCLRCSWAFIVADRGRISALGDADEPLSDPQNSGRVKTFVDGPCTPLPADTCVRRAHLIVKPPVRKPRPAFRRRADGIPQITAYK